MCARFVMFFLCSFSIYSNGYLFLCRLQTFEEKIVLTQPQSSTEILVILTFPLPYRSTLDFRGKEKNYIWTENRSALIDVIGCTHCSVW